MHICGFFPNTSELPHKESDNELQNVTGKVQQCPNGDMWGLNSKT